MNYGLGSSDWTQENFLHSEVTVAIEEVTRKAERLIFPVNYINSDLVLGMITFLVGGEIK